MALDTNKYQADAGSVKVESTNPPILRIIQKGSAEFDVTHKQHKEKMIAGCKVGDIIHATLGTIIPRPLEVIPLHSQTMYAEWRPKKLGGGFITHRPMSIVSDKGYSREDRKEFLGENELLLTIYYFVLYRSKDEWLKAVIPFTATGLKHARRWAKIINSHTDEAFREKAPPYACIYLLNTEPENNEKGSWMGWSIEKGKALAALPQAEAEAMLELAHKTGMEARQGSQAALPVAAGGEDVPY